MRQLVREDRNTLVGCNKTLGELKARVFTIIYVSSVCCNKTLGELKVLAGMLHDWADETLQ